MMQDQVASGAGAGFPWRRSPCTASEGEFVVKALVPQPLRAFPLWKIAIGARSYNEGELHVNKNLMVYN
jgi:hypothetical protein